MKHIKAFFYRLGQSLVLSSVLTLSLSVARDFAPEDQQQIFKEGYNSLKAEVIKHQMKSQLDNSGVPDELQEKILEEVSKNKNMDTKELIAHLQSTMESEIANNPELQRKLSESMAEKQRSPANVLKEQQTQRLNQLKELSTH